MKCSHPSPTFPQEDLAEPSQSLNSRLEKLFAFTQETNPGKELFVMIICALCP